MDFKVFKNKYIIKGELTVLTALHIGSGIEKDGKDAPFISLDEDNQFYIPGSSFRGYLSTKLERLVDSQNNISLKDKNTNEFLNEADVKLIFGYTNLDKEKSEDVKKRIVEKFFSKKVEEMEEKEFNKKLNEVKNMAGRIHIADMPLTVKVESVTRDGIRIDRNTGATKRGGKFDYDVVPAGTTFEIKIELENIEKYQLDLIGLALHDIMSVDGDLFGGKTSRGIGRCRIENNLKVCSIDTTNPETLKKYIFRRKFEKENEDFKFSTDNLDLEVK